MTTGWQHARDLVGARLPMPITHVVPVRHPESAQVAARRRHVVATTSLVGTVLLGTSLAARPNSSRFYVLTLGAAVTWTVGGLASGPLHLGWIEGRDRHLRRPLVTPVATGAAAFASFYACALVVRRIPVLDTAISRVLAFAEEGNLPLVLFTTYANGMGEEVFFRGALYAALPTQQVTTSTAIYTLATVTTRNPALVIAAAFMGSLFALQRRATGGLQAPLITHLTWSTLMVRYLPPLFRPAAAEQP